MATRNVWISLAAGLLLAVPSLAGATVFSFEAILSCDQEVPSTCGSGGSGTGSATITYDDATNLLSWSLSHSGLSSTVTAAHFHGPATTSQNAGVQISIGTANPAIGSATLTETQESQLLSELWYINVHSTNFPGGEIRGQVLLVPEAASSLLLALAAIGLVRGRRWSH